MEEIINRLSKAVATYSFEATNYPNCIVFREDLENLINKYKEQYQRLNEMAWKLTEAYTKIHDKEKIIELMCVDLMVCGTDFISFGMFTGNLKKDKELVIEYYEKKAKGE